jgi:hypothetical protein
MSFKLLMILLFLAVTGCVAPSKYNLAKIQLSDCVRYNGMLRQELNAKNVRLDRFNQINQDGSLR